MHSDDDCPENGNRNQVKSIQIGILVLATGALAYAQAATDVRFAWEFDGDTTEGWRAGRHLPEVTVRNGILSGRSTGHDPQLTSPLFSLPATPFQEVHMRLKCSQAGQGQLFFSNTTDPPYDGFSGSKLVTFTVTAADTWEEIRIRPFWQGEETVIHIRFDPPGHTEFKLDWLRIVERGTGGTPVAQTRWDWDGGPPQGWRPSGATAWQSPLLDADSAALPWLRLSLAADVEGRGVVRWASGSTSGLAESAFFFAGDGVPHTYSMDLLSQAAWTGRILLLEIDLTPREGGTVDLRRVELADTPFQEPDILVPYFGPENALNRLGRPCRFLLRLVNQGAVSANDASVSFSVDPADARITAVTPLLQQPFPLPPDMPVTGYITVEPSHTGQVVLRCTARLPDRTRELTSAAMRVTDPPEATAEAAIPPPRPARTDYLIGTYYYPGFGEERQWRELERSAPWAKPVLGYYDEGNPECVDWQIKWAVEHGVSFFLVDWYWVAGRRRHEHYLEAYRKSRFRNYLKWAVMWANHNPPGTHSVEDWESVTRYWIETFFNTPEYMTLDGKPLVAIWAPNNLREDLGGSDRARDMLARAQVLAKEAGLPGISFVSMRQSAPETLKNEGYTHATSYHWWADARERAQNRDYLPFSLVADRSAQAWNSAEERLENAGVTFIPVVDTGWDARPRHGTRTLVLYDRTPAQFTRILTDMRTWLDKRGENLFILGPWNEWTEGSYIEPCTEFGFDMLRAIHSTFCDGPPPAAFGPADLGLGPYDFDLEDPGETRTEWVFKAENGPLGWRILMGLADLQTENGTLTARTTSRDPALSSQWLNLPATDTEAVEVVMSVTPAPAEREIAALFWATSSAPVHSGAHVVVSLAQDSREHTYTLDVAGHPRWRGLIRNLRFDPCQSAGRTVRIRSIRLRPARQHTEQGKQAPGSF